MSKSKSTRRRKIYLNHYDCNDESLDMKLNVPKSKVTVVSLYTPLYINFQFISFFGLLDDFIYLIIDFNKDISP